MNLWCLDDKGLWGQQLRDEARSRGWKTGLFSVARQTSAIPADAYVFMRISQERARMAQEKEIAEELHCRGIKLIPSIYSCLPYEDKIAQTELYRHWMPDTGIYADPDAAFQDIRRFGFPFLSKSATGSASRNVRIIVDEASAREEIHKAFGPGIDAPHKYGELVQRGYLLWQEFLPGNAYDYRVVRVGRYNMLLQRHNKPGTPFASGSGRNNPVNYITGEVEEVLDFANRFFDAHDLRWCGIDVVRDTVAGDWMVLETTLGWTAKAYEGCRFFGTDYYGKDIWKLLCDEIEVGVFA